MQCINPVWILIKTKPLGEKKTGKEKKKERDNQGNLNIDWIFANIKEVIKVFKCGMLSFLKVFFKDTF